MCTTSLQSAVCSHSTLRGSVHCGTYTAWCLQCRRSLFSPRYETKFNSVTNVLKDFYYPCFFRHTHIHTRVHARTRNVSTAKPVSVFKQGTSIKFQNFCIEIHNDCQFYCQHNFNIDTNLAHSLRSTVRPYAASNYLLTSQITKT